MAMTSPSLPASVSLQAMVSVYPLPALAFQMTPQSPVAALNRAAEELTGFSPNDASRMSLVQFLHPEDRPLFETILRRMASMPSQLLEGVRLQNKAGLVVYVSPSLVSPAPPITIAGASFGFCFFEEAHHLRNSWEALKRRFGSALSLVPEPKETAQTPNGALTYKSLIDLNQDLRDTGSRLYKKLGEPETETPVSIRLTGEQASRVLSNGYLDTFLSMLNLFSRKITVPKGKKITVSYDRSGQSIPVLDLVYEQNTFKKVESGTA